MQYVEVAPDGAARLAIGTAATAAQFVILFVKERTGFTERNVKNMCQCEGLVNSIIRAFASQAPAVDPALVVRLPPLKFRLCWPLCSQYGRVPSALAPSRGEAARL